MRTIKAFAIVAALLLTASGAFAQRGHGPVGGTMQPGGTGSGMGNDMGNGMAEGMGGMSILVAPDGTVVTTSVSLNTTTNVYSMSVVALSSTGAVAWRWAAPNGIHRIELAGNLVLVAGGQMNYDGTTTTSDVALTALALSNGAVAWKTALPGVAVSIEPAANQIVVLTMQSQSTGQGSGMGSGGMGGGMGSGMGGGSHDGTPGTGTGGTGMMNGARTLVALSNSGVILWSVPLSQ